MSKSALIKSSIAKKYWMALTGLFLCLFLVGHLAGNLQLMMEFVRLISNDMALKLLQKDTSIEMKTYCILHRG